VIKSGLVTADTVDEKQVVRQLQESINVMLLAGSFHDCHNRCSLL
jgi:hypothetical protein